MTGDIRGVNFGGWLVLEKWLTPSLFKGIDAADEHTFMRHPDAKKRITKHRDTYITEKDFKWLSEQGINLVRIPVGYWLFEPIDGYTPTVRYLDKAFRLAEKHGINILVDLHAVRGSQNGRMHGGKIGEAEWFAHQAYRDETLDLLCKIADKYKDSPALWGIELLNEPHVKGHYFMLLKFYRQAYRRLCDILRPGTYVVFHDGFKPLLFAGALHKQKDHPVAMDVHWYAFRGFGADPVKFLRILAFGHKLLLGLIRPFQPVIAGEWSAVLPRRYMAGLTPEEREKLLRKHISTQLDVFDGTIGWIFWTYKIDGGNMWNLRELVEKGIWPDRQI